MIYLFFNKVSNLSETKSRYRELAKKFHPDMTGYDSSDAFKRITEEYQTIIKTNKFPGIKSERTTNFIKLLLIEKSEHGYKKYWVYHRFLEWAEDEKIDLDEEDFKILSKALGYEEGWAFYKYKEYKQ